MHEESSSSQNVKLYISSIARGADEGTRRVTLSDSSSFLLFEEDVSSFAEAQILDTDDIELLQQGADYLACFRKGLELCARREHSKFQLAIKLQQRGYVKGLVQRVLDALEAISALDDRRYADIWVRTKARAVRDNRFMLKAKLTQAGLTRGIIDEALERYCDSSYDRETLVVAIDKYKRKRNFTREKCIAALMRKGYGYNEIINELKKAEN